MNSVRLLVFVFFAVVLISCGGAKEAEDGLREETVSIYAGKGVFIRMTLLSEELEDSLLYVDEMPGELRLSSNNCNSTMTAMLVPGCGSTPSDRMDYLSGGDVLNLDTGYVNTPGEVPGFTVVMYVRGDSSVVERIWNRGGGELAVLRVKSRNTSFNILLTSIKGILSTAEIIEPESGLNRLVELSDRSRAEIVEEVNADVTVSPEITHRIFLSVDPLEREMSVLDSMTIDFRPTQTDSQLMMSLPFCDNGTSFEAITGSALDAGDSVMCTADSSRVFSGLYSGNWSGFISSSTDRVTANGLQLNPSTSFQSGMWFYPGCDIPSAYMFDISVPDKGYEVYAPLQEVARSVRDSLLTISYKSPIGGIKGPLSWATGGFTENIIARGRSRYICLESDSTALEMIGLADAIAEVLWRNMGYEGAELDFVVVRSLDVPVFITGPGCVFLSTDMLASVKGYETWSDSLIRGTTVPATSIVFETAKAFLAGSTYLSENLKNVLAAWSVYKFALTGNEEASSLLLEAFRKYYLYTTELYGGIEYAVADPQLNVSPLHDPVIFGKAPIVMEFLSHEIPAFERAVPRALGNLRHSGDSFNRLFSAMGISENTEYGELFFQWLYSPGVPQLQVTWADSAGELYLSLEQFQPGQDFPLGSILKEVLVFTEGDSFELRMSPGSSEGLYTGDISDVAGRIRAVDIDPESILPADIIYNHIN